MENKRTISEDDSRVCAEFAKLGEEMVCKYSASYKENFPATITSAELMLTTLICQAMGVINLLQTEKRLPEGIHTMFVEGLNKLIREKTSELNKELGMKVKLIQLKTVEVTDGEEV